MSYTKQIDKQATSVEYIGNWSGLAGGSEVRLESISNESNGAGTFGDNNGAGRAVANTTGASAVLLQEGTHFQYDKRLDASTTEDATDGFGSTAGGLIDTGVSGALSKPIRIVENTKNIKDETGLNLKVYAKNLSTLESPPSDRVYVDPASGTIVVPSPNYFSKFETSVNGYERKYLNYVPDSYVSTSPATVSIVTGKFGNCFKLQVQNSQYGGLRFFGNNIILPPSNKGCLSFWLKLYTLYNYNDVFRIYGPVNFEVQFVINGNEAYSRCNVLLNGTSEYASGNDSSYSFYNVFRHVYIVWDLDAGLSSDKTFKLFIDNELKVSLSEAINLQNTNPSGLKGTSTAHVHANGFYADNIKLWFEIPTEDPSWEYNSGNGRENALHYIYGETNDYAPLLSSPGGVGYYYIASSSTPATLSGVQDNITKTLEDATNINAGVAQLGSLGSLSNSSFQTLAEGVDFQYDKRLDASTTEDATDGFGATAGGIVDTGVSGSLAAGTAIRIVDGSSGSALNVKNASGLNLKVYAKNLVALDSPTVDRVYVDPATSKFILPGPIFYNKCESVSNFLNPDRNILGNTPSIVESVSRIQTVSGKFGNGLRIGPATSGLDYYYNLIETDKVPVTMTACILSTWFLFDSTYTYVYFDVGDKRIVFYPASADLAILRRSDNVALALGTNVLNITPAITYDTWFHLYILVDESNGITGGKSVSVKCNGTEKLSYTGSFEMHGNNISISVNSASSGQPAYSAIDNIKIWDSIITEDPAWEFNSGTGRENALHTLYGSASDYAPVLTSPGGVGYYKSGAAGSKAIIRI